MPRTTTTIQLTDARCELTEQLEELADETVTRTEDVDESERQDVEAAMQSVAQSVERQRDGVDWALREYGDDAAVTIGGLTTGEYGRVEDRATDARAEKDGNSTQGIVRVFQIAAGLEAAPFLDGTEEFDDRARAIRGLPPAFSAWLQARVNEATSVSSGNSKTFAALLEEKRDGATSTDESSRSSPESS